MMGIHEDNDNPIGRIVEFDGRRFATVPESTTSPGSTVAIMDWRRPAVRLTMADLDRLDEMAVVAAL